MIEEKEFSDAAFVALKSKDKEYRVTDILGLYMRIQISGKKSWQLRLKNNDNKWIWVGLGSYLDLSLKNARLQAVKYQTGELKIVTRTERLFLRAVHLLILRNKVVQMFKHTFCRD